MRNPTPNCHIVLPNDIWLHIITYLRPVEMKDLVDTMPHLGPKSGKYSILDHASKMAFLSLKKIVEEYSKEKAIGLEQIVAKDSLASIHEFLRLGRLLLRDHVDQADIFELKEGESWYGIYSFLDVFLSTLQEEYTKAREGWIAAIHKRAPHNGWSDARVEEIVKDVTDKFNRYDQNDLLPLGFWFVFGAPSLFRTSFLGCFFNGESPYTELLRAYQRVREDGLGLECFVSNDRMEEMNQRDNDWYYFVAIAPELVETLCAECNIVTSEAGMPGTADISRVGEILLQIMNSDDRRYINSDSDIICFVYLFSKYRYGSSDQRTQNWKTYSEEHGIDTTRVDEIYARVSKMIDNVNA